VGDASPVESDGVFVPLLDRPGNFAEAAEAVAALELDVGAETEGADAAALASAWTLAFLKMASFM